MACLLKNEPASCCTVADAEGVTPRWRSESESEQGADGGGQQTRNRVSYPWPG
jgi:hypothetical protein